MTLPIDEMLTELRAVLEACDDSPSYKTVSDVITETNRIIACCEDELEEE